MIRLVEFLALPIVNYVFKELRLEKKDKLGCENEAKTYVLN